LRLTALSSTLHGLHCYPGSCGFLSSPNLSAKHYAGLQLPRLSSASRGTPLRILGPPVRE